MKDVTDPADITAHSIWKRSRIDYVIAGPKDTKVFAKNRLEEIDIVHGLGIYKAGSEQSGVSAHHR